MVRRGGRGRILASLAMGATAGAIGASMGCGFLFDIPDGYLADAGQDQKVEGAPPLDAGADQGPPFCSTVSPTPNVCSDFDEGGDPTTGWDNQGQNPDPGLVGGGARAIDGKLSFSRPNSLLVTTPALGTSADQSGSFLIKSIQYAPATLNIGAEVYISSLNIPVGNGAASLFAVLFGTDLSTGAILLEDSAGTALSVSTPTTQDNPARIAFTDTNCAPANLPMDEWVQILIAVNQGSISVSAADASGYNGIAIAPVTVGAPVQIVVGVQDVGPTEAPFRMNLDNVYLTYSPEAP
jgi:hypothetical protein